MRAASTNRTFPLIWRSIPSTPATSGAARNSPHQLTGGRFLSALSDICFRNREFAMARGMMSERSASASRASPRKLPQRSGVAGRSGPLAAHGSLSRDVAVRRAFGTRCQDHFAGREIPEPGRTDNAVEISLGHGRERRVGSQRLLEASQDRWRGGRRMRHLNLPRQSPETPAPGRPGTPRCIRGLSRQTATSPAFLPERVPAQRSIRCRAFRAPRHSP
jgi:hypothetical protein